MQLPSTFCARLSLLKDVPLSLLGSGRRTAASQVPGHLLLWLHMQPSIELLSDTEALEALLLPGGVDKGVSYLPAYNTMLVNGRPQSQLDALALVLAPDSTPAAAIAAATAYLQLHGLSRASQAWWLPSHQATPARLLELRNTGVKLPSCMPLGGAAARRHGCL